jgi:hypothetical protein
MLPVVPVVDGLVVSGYVPGVAGVVPGVVGVSGATGLFGELGAPDVFGLAVEPGVFGLVPGVVGVLGVVWVGAPGFPGVVELCGVVCAPATPAKMVMTIVATS